MDDFRNQLYFGDNLEVLRKYIADSSVDLIYLDPPFNSKADYNILYKEVDGTPSEAQFHAFTDYWRWDTAAIKAYRDLLASDRAPEELKRLIEGFEQFLGHNAMLAYLVMMAPRLVELKRVLKPTGSIYLHCDPTAGHYLKILMDAVFGVKNFRNEIIWKRKTGRGETNRAAFRFGVMTDYILYYAKTQEAPFERQYKPNDPEYIRKSFKHVEPGTGRLYQADNLASPSPRPNLMYDYKGYKHPPTGWAISREKMEQWDKDGRLHFPKSKDGRIRRKRYLDELKGETVQNLWDDIKPISSHAKERLGYPTQKPQALLERILQTSSNEGDIVLDPFCGCGTTIAAAQAFNRKWIGIDITYLAVNLIKNRMVDHFADEVVYEVHGVPKDWESARELAQKTDVPRKEFELWALSLVAALPKGDPYKRGGPDQGVDGIIRFEDGKKLGKLKSKRVIVQVKSDKNPGVPFVRDLRGTMENEKAVMGVLILLYEPGKRSTIYTVAADAGLYNCEIMGGKDYPRIQVLTVRGLLEETEFLKMPITRRPIQRAERIQKDKQKKLEV